MDPDETPHMSAAEVRQSVAALRDAEDDARRDLIARLAWRPAWAIRSRRGAIAALRDMCRRRKTPD